MMKLMWAVQALAQPAGVQLGLFPDFACKADELVLDFDQCREAALLNEGDSMSVEQTSALASLDAMITSMSGPEQPHWCDESIRNDDAWQSLRLLARATLRAFGWPDDVPPIGRSIYVGPPEPA